ncbi:MAG: hypothetical protein LBJ89_00105 [Holosporales bacterium]|jgi:hypothetical protein|nr:hypothetical protein [Holosporales bacterium]
MGKEIYSIVKRMTRIHEELYCTCCSGGAGESFSNGYKGWLGTVKNR